MRKFLHLPRERETDKQVFDAKILQVSQNLKNFYLKYSAIF